MTSLQTLITQRYVFLTKELYKSLLTTELQPLVCELLKTLNVYHQTLHYHGKICPQNITVTYLGLDSSSYRIELTQNLAKIQDLYQAPDLTESLRLVAQQKRARRSQLYHLRKHFNQTTNVNYQVNSQVKNRRCESRKIQGPPPAQWYAADVYSMAKICCQLLSPFNTEETTTSSEFFVQLKSLLDLPWKQRVKAFNSFIEKNLS
jgi:hypothetical protein